MNVDPRFLGQFDPNTGFSPQRPPWSPQPNGNGGMPAQPRFEVVRHPSAPAQLPFAIRDNHNGGYLTGSSPLFPRVFATPAEAHDAIQEHLQAGERDPSSDSSSASLQFAANRHPALASPTANAAQASGKTKQGGMSAQGYQYQISDLSDNSQFGGDYRKVIIKAAQKYGIDPRALQALIYKESKGNPNEVNHNGNGTTDYGIMQVNSGTKDPSTYNWNDGTQNIDAGASVFAGKLRQAHGNYREAFRRYNGRGPAAEAYASDVYGHYKGLGGKKP